MAKRLQSLIPSVHYGESYFVYSVYVGEPFHMHDAGLLHGACITYKHSAMPAN